MKVDSTDLKIIMFEMKINVFSFLGLSWSIDFDFIWCQIFALLEVKCLYYDGVYDVNSLYTDP